MRSRGKRRVFVVSGLAVLAVVAAACSGGSSRVETSPQTTPTTGATSSTTGTARRAHVTKAPAKQSTKKVSTTPSTRGASVTAQRSTVGTLGGPSPTLSDTPTTAGPTVTTPPATSAPTTVPAPHAVPYDPSQPINLCCEAGVTPAERARAEQLVRDTLRYLPRYANPATAYADGYRSIGDGFTGTEHYVKWAYVNDGRILNAQYPESLVYQWPDGRSGPETLVSAMYMLPFGSRFTDAPDVGGPLTQWHVHNDLCLTPSPGDPSQETVSLTNFDGTCTAPATKAPASPMLHVWIVKNACGPFAPLEGIEGGQVPPGDTPLCDKLHGSVF